MNLDTLHCNAFSHLIYTPRRRISMVSSVRSCWIWFEFAIVFVFNGCSKMGPRRRRSRNESDEQCACVLCEVNLIDVRNYVDLFLFAFIVRHWCDYIALIVVLVLRALSNSTSYLIWRLLMSLTRIVSTSTHYRLICHWIESKNAHCIRISVRTIDKNEDVTRWMVDVCYGQSISVEIMMSFIDVEWRCKKAIHAIDAKVEIWFYCYVWRGAVVIVSGYFLTWKTFQHMKCLFNLLTMHFSWALNGFHDFEATAKLHREERKRRKNIEKHITLSLVCSISDGWTNRVRPKIFIVSLSGSCESMRTPRW